MGKTWQFFSPASKMIFESSDIKEIREKLISGQIPKHALCLKNKVGEKRPIQDSIAKEEGAVKVLFNPFRYHVEWGAKAGAEQGPLPNARRPCAP